MTNLKLGVAAAALLALVPTAVLAQDGTVTGAAGGAATGAVVGGPVGAAVGGVTGAIVGTVLDPPPAEVRQYVLQEQVPSVRVEREIVVGEPLPDTVEIHTIPEHDTYAYTVVNDQRVIVDPKTRTVIEVVR